MKKLATIAAILAAGPALAHDAAIAHTHDAWPFAAGIALIATALVAARLRARRVKVRA